MSHDLSTTEAAHRMGVSVETVRDLCARGLLSGATQAHENGPWRIPADAVHAWIRQRPSSLPMEHPRWERFRQHPFIFYPTIVFGIIAALSALLFGIISAGADFGPAREQFRAWGQVRAFPQSSEHETLIVIATFHTSQGVVDTEIHHEIRQAIQHAAANLGTADLRVEVEPTRLTADAQSAAKTLGERYNASMIIWGADTGARVTVNFLNLREPEALNAQAKISEIERTQLANPSAYASFITRDLPKQLTFLALFTVGQSAYGKSDYVEATRIIEQAVAALDPAVAVEGSWNAYLYLGWLYQRESGDLTRAFAIYDQAIKLKPDYAPIYNNRGIAHQEQGDLVGAIADYDQAIKLDPHAVEAYFNRGVARRRQGDLAGAIADYNQAIKLDPDFGGAYNNRGVAYEKQGDFVGAIADYDQVIKLNPDFGGAYFNRGGARWMQGDLAGAIADYNQAIKLDPDFGGAYFNRGLARKEQGDLAGAIADYDQAIKLDPDFGRAYFNRGVAYEEQGDFAGAIADFGQVIKLDPDAVDAYYNRGLVRRKQGDLAGAIADYDQVIKLKPDDALAFYNRGHAYKALRDLEAAHRDFQRAFDLGYAPARDELLE